MKEITEEQLLLAAKKLCELRGEDPDETVGYGHPNYPLMMYTKRVNLVRDELKDFSSKFLVITSVLGNEGNENKGD